MQTKTETDRKLFQQYDGRGGTCREATKSGLSSKPSIEVEAF